MRTPDSLTALVDHGIIDEVVRPLMSGKEAQVYLVLSGGEQRVAKIYKEAQNRSFQNRADYTEGRKVRNSRDQRAMGRGSRHGKAQNEAAWRSAEVDMIYRLRDAGVRVPNPHHFIDGVLIMELVVDAEGFPAPRLGDLVWEPADASALFKQLLGEVVRMLSIGVVHGDLSDFNVLMSATGPVVIDFPQSVDAATNANARKLLLRDVENLNRFAAKFDPAHSPLPYAEEMWELYKRNALTPDTQLTGRFKGAQKAANTTAVLDLISDANKDERKRREARGLSMRGTSADGTESPEAGPAVRGPAREERPGRAHDPRRGPGGREPRVAAPAERPARADAPPTRAPLETRAMPARAPRGRDDAHAHGSQLRARADEPRAAPPERDPRGVAEGREPRAPRPDRDQRAPVPNREGRAPQHDRDRAPRPDRDRAPTQSRDPRGPVQERVARNFDLQPPQGERASRPHAREREPRAGERHSGAQERVQRAERQAAESDTQRAPDRQPRAGQATLGSRAEDPRASTHGSRAEDPRGSAHGSRAEDPRASTSRPPERRVSSFGERVPYRAPHAEPRSRADEPRTSTSGPRGAGSAASQGGGAQGRGAERAREQVGPDSSSEYPKRPR